MTTNVTIQANAYDNNGTIGYSSYTISNIKDFLQLNISAPSFMLEGESLIAYITVINKSSNRLRINLTALSSEQCLLI